MRGWRLRGLFAVAAAAMATAWWMHGSLAPAPSGPSGARPPDRPAGSRAGSLTPDVVLRIMPRTAPAASPARPSRLSPLMQEFAAAKSWEPLHERLSRAAHRTPEEQWVLAEMLQQCAKVAGKEGSGSRWRLGGEGSRQRFIDSLPAKDPARERRIAAFDEINHDRCGAIASLEVVQKDLRALYEAGAAGADPKARAALVMRELDDQLEGPDGKPRFDPQAMPRITDAQVEVLREAASSGDPHALMAVASVLGMSLQNLNLRAGPDELPVEMGPFYGAAQLVACDLGYPCGAQSPRLLWACAMRGQCGASDYREYLYYYGQSPSSSQLVGQYESGLARAVHQRDWSYFTFHRGPSPTLAPYQAR